MAARVPRFVMEALQLAPANRNIPVAYSLRPTNRRTGLMYTAGKAGRGRRRSSCWPESRTFASAGPTAGRTFASTNRRSLLRSLILRRGPMDFRDVSVTIGFDTSQICDMGLSNGRPFDAAHGALQQDQLGPASSIPEAVR